MAAVAPEAHLDHGLASSESDVQRLYARYSQELVRFCRARLGSREEAEDAVQMTFLYALLALRRGVVPRFESAWLYKIATNVCLTRRRAAARRERIEVGRDAEELQFARPGHDSTELIDIDAALATLPERQRRAIVLREWQGLAYQEIADELEVSLSAVETLIFRARRSLARELSAERTAATRSRPLRALDLATLVGAIQSALGFSAVKVAAVVAATASVTAIVGGDGARRETPAPATQQAEAALDRELRVEKPYVVAREPARVRAAEPSLGVRPSAPATHPHSATVTDATAAPAETVPAPAGGSDEGATPPLAGPAVPAVPAAPALPAVSPPAVPVSLGHEPTAALEQTVPAASVDVAVRVPPLVTQPLPLPVAPPAIPLP